MKNTTLAAIADLLKTEPQLFNSAQKEELTNILNNPSEGEDVEEAIAKWLQEHPQIERSFLERNPLVSRVTRDPGQQPHQKDDGADNMARLDVTNKSGPDARRSERRVSGKPLSGESNNVSK